MKLGIILTAIIGIIVLAIAIAIGLVAAPVLVLPRQEPAHVFHDDRLCARFGSDSHEVSEVGEFVPHLRVLAAAGIEPADFPRLLFTPDQTPRRRLA